MSYLTSLHLHLTARHWRKDLQFALGVVVTVGGAAFLLSEVVRLFA